MSEDDADKTRVKETSPDALQGVSPTEDITRVAPNFPSTFTELEDNKTQIPAHAKSHVAAKTDKTRIAPVADSGNATGDVAGDVENLKQQKLRKQIQQKQLRQRRQEKLAQEMIKQGKLRSPSQSSKR